VRELANALERAAILADVDTLRGADLTLSRTQAGDPPDHATMAEIEREAIRRTLEEVGGNRRLAAERLGIGLRTLYDKLKRYEIG
jgi:DNA-binding NtrC family response regulator